MAAPVFIGAAAGLGVEELCTCRLSLEVYNLDLNYWARPLGFKGNGLVDV